MHFIFIVFLGGISGSALGSEPERIAVLDFIMEPEDQILRKILEDEVRAGLLEYSNPKELRILTRENMLLLLSDMGKDLSCLEGSCEVEIARNIGADYAIVGELRQYQEMWYLVVKLFDSDTGSLIAIKKIQRKQTVELIEDLKDESLSLFQALPIEIARVNTIAKEREKKEEHRVLDSQAQQKIPHSKRDVPSIEKDDHKVQFHLFSAQCHQSRAGFVPIGYCYDGSFVGPMHFGMLFFHAKIDQDFLGIYQLSLYNETNNFYGFMQLGMINITHHSHIGMQLAFSNTANDMVGMQLGVLNSTKKTVGMQLGIINTASKVYGMQIGLYNSAGDLHGVQLCLINSAEES